MLWARRREERGLDTCQEVSVSDVGEDIGKGCGMVSKCGYAIVRDTMWIADEGEMRALEEVVYRVRGRSWLQWGHESGMRWEMRWVWVTRVCLREKVNCMHLGPIALVCILHPGEGSVNSTHRDFHPVTWRCKLHAYNVHTAIIIPTRSDEATRYNTFSCLSLIIHL